jgi:hypothetical protein
MWTRLFPVLLLGFLPQGYATAQITVASSRPAVPIAAGASCLSTHSPSATRARCAELAAASRLRRQPRPFRPTGSPSSVGSAGKGALVGLGVGLGVGILAALIVAPGCEENQSQCTVGFIVGGGALGAGIGAAVAAVVGKQ